MSVFEAKSNFFVNPQNEATYFHKGDEFIVLSKDGDTVLMKQRNGNMAFKYSCNSLETEFNHIIV